MGILGGIGDIGGDVGGRGDKGGHGGPGERGGKREMGIQDMRRGHEGVGMGDGGTEGRGDTGRQEDVGPEGLWGHGGCGAVGPRGL